MESLLQYHMTMILLLDNECLVAHLNPNSGIRCINPLKTRISLSVINTVSDSSLRTDGTVNRYPFRLLRTLGLTAAPPNPKPFHGVATSDVTVDINRKLWFRLYVPTTTDTDDDLPVVVFFHGGGFVHLAADLKAYDIVCRRFARTVPAVVVSVDYRLAPEHRYPAQYDDGFDVLKFLDSETSVLPPKADYSRCFLAGDSAGGNLAHHVAKRFCECKSEFHKLKVIGLIAIQPFFGGEERTKSEIDLNGVDVIVSTKRTDWMWKAFTPPGSGMDRDHEVINVSGPRAADLSKLNFPATMVVIAGFDSLKDWQMRYYQWLKDSGKEVYLLEYPNMIHAFYIFPELPETTQVTLDIKKFIHEQCSKAN